MTAKCYGSLFEHTSAATFRAWGKELSDTMAAGHTGATLTAVTAASAAQALRVAEEAVLVTTATDGSLSIAEKPAVISYVNALNAEQAGLDAQADALSIVAEKTAYDASLTDLNVYLATLTDPVLWSDLGDITTIGGTPVTARTGTTVVGGVITKTAGTGWTNADATSVVGLTGTCIAKGRSTSGPQDMMFGLNSDPNTDAGYTGLDYAIHPNGAWNVYSYESSAGTLISTWVAGDRFAVEYAGTTVTYKKNGVVIRTVSTTAGRTFYFDSALYQTGSTISEVYFGATEPQFLFYFQAVYLARQNLFQAIAVATQGTVVGDLIRCTDGGQVDWTTVGWPAINTTHFEIFRFNDVLQSTAPVFIKVEYGTGASAAYPMLFITVGQGTDGIGNLTGVKSARLQCFQYDDAPTTYLSNYMTYLCTLPGYLGCSYKHNASSAASYAYGFFMVGRSVATTGIMTGEGVTVCGQGSAGATGYTMSSVSYLYGTTSANTTTYTFMPHTLLATYFGGINVQVFKHYTVLPQVRTFPFVLTYIGTELPAYLKFVAAPVGAVNYTYLTLGPWQWKGGVNPASDSFIAMVYM